MSNTRFIRFFGGSGGASGLAFCTRAIGTSGYDGPGFAGFIDQNTFVFVSAIGGGRNDACDSARNFRVFSGARVDP
jgi:hypothetical protein